MSTLDVDGLRKAIDDVITRWAAGAPDEIASPTNEITEVKDPRVLPEGKRAVRTKNTGDRVYLLDDDKKTRRWVTTPEILTALGFEGADVIEVTDEEMMKYQMGPAIFKADNEPA